MTGEWPRPDEIIAALRESGHLLEQEVASELERLGLNVVTNRAFEDADEGKSRELDVWANYTAHHDPDSKLSVFVWLLSECKATSAPFAVMTRPLSRYHRGQAPEEFVFPVPRFETDHRKNEKGLNTWHEEAAFYFLKLQEHYWPWTDEHRGVSIVRLHRSKGDWRADNTGVFDSLVYPLAKALKAFRAPFLTGRSHPGPEDWKSIVLFVPMVVVTSRLFCVDGTSATPTARVAGHVRLQREFKTKTLSGLYGIDFVQREHLAKFVAETVIPFADHLARLVQERPDVATSKTPADPGSGNSED